MYYVNTIILEKSLFGLTNSSQGQYPIYYVNEKCSKKTKIIKNILEFHNEVHNECHFQTNHTCVCSLRHCFCHYTRYRYTQT